MEFLRELFTTYWSQMTLIFLGIGYLIKRILELTSRKKEINHNLFQDKKLDAVNSFFRAYAEVQQMWHGIAIHDILRGKIESKEIDIIVSPAINKLQTTVLELQIYFEQKEFAYFNLVYENMLDINKELSDLYFEDLPITIPQKVNRYYSYRNSKIIENDKILKQISFVIRNTFNNNIMNI